MSADALTRDLWRAATAPPPDGGWMGLHDQVMGGRSSGRAQLLSTDTGRLTHVQLSGQVSLDHGGGFASFRCRLSAPQPLGHARSVILVLRGDGESYKCCLHRQAETDGVQWQADLVAPPDWTTLSLPLSRFVARRRGRGMHEQPWQPEDVIHQIGIMAVRSEPGPFELHLASIALA
jgi:hypothetical protein